MRDEGRKEKSLPSTQTRGRCERHDKKRRASACRSKPGRFVSIPPTYPLALLASLVASAPSFGAPVPEEPMNSLRPSGKVTSRPLARHFGVHSASFD